MQEESGTQERRKETEIIAPAIANVGAGTVRERLLSGTNRC
jgi:hypothetical protein